jgi:hypothetical protein
MRFIQVCSRATTKSQQSHTSLSTREDREKEERKEDTSSDAKLLFQQSAAAVRMTVPLLVGWLVGWLVHDHGVENRRNHRRQLTCRHLSGHHGKLVSCRDSIGCPLTDSQAAFLAQDQEVLSSGWIECFLEFILPNANA